VEHFGDHIGDPLPDTVCRFRYLKPPGSQNDFIKINDYRPSQLGDFLTFYFLRFGNDFNKRVF